MCSTVWLLCGLLLAKTVPSVAAKHCTQRTAGAECCEFPFIYQGQSYSSCIVGGLSTKPWCATTSNYDHDGQWNHCEGITCYTCSSMESWADCESRQDTQTCPYYYSNCMQFSDEHDDNTTRTFFRKCAMERECSAKQCQGKSRIRCDLFCCMNDLCNAGSKIVLNGLVTLLCLLIGWLINVT